MTIGLVSDSTAGLSAGQLSDLDVVSVPLTVSCGALTYVDGVDISSTTVVALMRSGEVVTTAHPTPEAFLDAYRQCALAGATSVVSVHLSEGLSSACASARVAAAQSPVPVRVIDSRSVGMGLGFAVIAGARARDAGGSLDDVVRAIGDVVSQTHVWFCVDDLEYLRRGGRIGSASALVGSALSIKPILTLVDGSVATFERVRTSSRAMARLEECAVEQAVLMRSQIAVEHCAAPDVAQHLANALRDRLPGTCVEVYELPVVVAAHSGPGTVGVVVSPVGAIA